MLCTTLLNVLAMLPQGGQGTSTAPVVINEFNYDDSSTDTLEFVELYNRTGQPVDLSNWTVVGDDSNGVNFTETIAAGTILNAGDFLVIGDANVPNVDIVLASGFLQNSNESITLYDASQLLIDTLIYEANKGVFNAALAEAEGVWGNFLCVEGNESTWSRLRDGFDTDDNGHDFRLQPWSPGTSNNQPFIAAVVEPFDGLTIGSDVPGWGSSFVSPRVIDPTIVDNTNLNAIPTSPQGGFAGVAWDPAGGGDSVMLLADPSRVATFEAYVYIASAQVPVGEQEMWSLGFGTTGTFYNFPDPTGTLGYGANGNTGVSWTLVRDEFGANIYLIDHNNGGLGANPQTNAVVIGTIPITAGTNDGWQRLYLQVVAGNVTARFGGNYGLTDGTTFTTTVTDIERGLYVGYREFLTANADARPFTWDLMTYQDEASAYAYAYGAGCDGLTLSSSSSPFLGNAAFTLDVNNVGALPIALVGLGTTATNPGLDLTTIGMAGCRAYTSLDAGIFVTGAVNAGTGSLLLPIPSSPAIAGAGFAAQGLGFTSATALGLSSSNGLEFRFGL
jgi:hypothetical protein